MRVLVTGATGAIGTATVAQLIDAGHDVRIFARRVPTAARWGPKGPFAKVDVTCGDIRDGEAVGRAMTAMDAVIHLAALLHVTAPDAAMKEDYRAVNVDGTSVVVRAAERAGVRRLVFASTIAVYGRTDGALADEEGPVAPETWYAETKLEAEQVVLAARARQADRTGGAMGAVLRVGAVYGAQVKGNYRRLVEALRRGRFVPVGPGSNRRSLIHEHDLARAFTLALTHERAGGRVFNIANAEPATVDEIVTAICRALGRRPPRMRVPLAGARLAAGVVEALAKPIGIRAPVTRAALDKYVEDLAVDTTRAREELGFVPYLDLSAGWTRTVKELRAAGAL